MSRAAIPRAVGDQITTLLTGFTLTTAAREMVSRFVQAEQQLALPLLLEVLELDAQERHERRITRLRRASKLVLYVVPATSVSGAILLVGYLGGAVATHVRVGNPLASHVLFPMYVAALVWGGLYLREPRLRALLPLRR